ncbi:cytosolic phospholipase A2 gamma-like [Electrophorus electricus]|uniref:cytosolic phospholipase A2 gamma-like n=1 Tax=Electrophorus electricus TaxID=8005 RepID=UPI0015D06EB2|nr:cytosolic phospholipase A2 gamma-like [Electrophorus electricus]
MIGLLGSLSQLSEEKLLDCIMYLSGVSGSTWCMASAYQEPDWSKQMETVKQNIIQKLTSDQVNYHKTCCKLRKMCEKDNFSITDIWAVLIVSSVVKEIDEQVLTEQRGQHTKNPYPIYTVIDKKSKYDTLCKDSWFEITPHECGYSLTGAFVDSKCLGSRFEKGAKTEEQPELDMLYIQGLCGSALADGEEIKKTIFKGLLKLSTGLKNLVLKANISASNDDELVMHTLLELNLHFFNGEDLKNDITKMNELLKEKHDKEGNEVKLQEPITDEILSNYTLKVCDCLPHWFPKTVESKTNTSLPNPNDQVFCGIVIAKCMRKVWQWDWGTHYNFLYKMTVDEVHPSILESKTRQYEDTGLLLNSPYFSVLRKERNVDLIISLDFSDGDPFETVDKAAQMCKDLQIPFPTVEHPENEEEPKDFYVFKNNPNAPVVIHIPLFNTVNCKGEVKMWKDIYHTFQLSYNDKMINDLLKKAGLNITNTKEKLLKEIEEVIKRKKTALGKL